MSPELISVRNRCKSHDLVERGSGSTSREPHCALSFIGKLGICFHGNPPVTRARGFVDLLKMP
jgi:hypothetical protein